jgi:Pilus formation protein N terminal region
MARKTLSLITLLVVAVAAVGLTGLGTLTARAQSVDMQVTSSDATSRFVVLGLYKSLVIDVPRDIQDVLVSDLKVVSFVVRSKRRIFINGLAIGHTNVYLFDAAGRPIGGLDITVQPSSPSAEAENYPFPADVVEVYRGGNAFHYSCSPIVCVGGEKADVSQAPSSGSSFSFSF